VSAPDRAPKSSRETTEKKPSRSAATAVLADRLRERSAARAARSVEEDLLSPPSDLASVTGLGTQHDSESELAPAPTPERKATFADSEPLEAPAPPAEADPGTAKPKTAAERRPKPAGPATPVHTSPSKPVAGPDGRLELRGQRVTKMTLELPLPLVDALARWERDETRATGQRVYRERLIDCALSQLPSDVEDLVVLARGLPEPLRHADTEQVGTRVLESIAVGLRNLRPELRLRRVRDVYLRHIYAAAIYTYLTDLGVTVELEST
jgi:hypothetical protein